MPDYLFEHQKPLTIFQLTWPSLHVDAPEMMDLLSNFQVRDQFEALFKLRQEMKPDLMSLTRLLKREGEFDFDLIFIVPQPDSALSTCLESTFGSEASEFFFGCNVDVKMAHEDERLRASAKLPRECKTPARVMKYTVDLEEPLQITVRVYRQRKKRQLKRG